MTEHKTVVAEKRERWAGMHTKGVEAAEKAMTESLHQEGQDASPLLLAAIVAMLGTLDCSLMKMDATLEGILAAVEK